MVPQVLGAKKLLVNSAAEVETKESKSGESAQTQSQEPTISTGSKPKAFYNELTKMMFAANVVELFDQYKAKVPEDLLENTEFMPKLFELFDSFNIEFPKKVVPNFKVSNPADLDISNAQGQEMGFQGSENKNIIGKGKEQYEEVKLNEMPQAKSKKIFARPDDDDEEEVPQK